MLALFTGIGIVVGTFGSLAVPIGFVSAFWPGQAVQSIGSIWFGWWGGIGVCAFAGLHRLPAGKSIAGHDRRLGVPQILCRSFAAERTRLVDLDYLWRAAA